MARNIEIKARLAAPEATRALIEKLRPSAPVVIYQLDTFFNCPRGRLKLREFSPAKGELIFYRRVDQPGAKQSEYQIFPTDQPEPLRQILSAALGSTEVVVKKRTLYLAGRTRIHLDEVEGLGHFLELEVVLREDESPQDGERIAAELMTALELNAGQLVAGAYADLLHERAGSEAKKNA